MMPQDRQLTPLQRQIAFEKGTERAFTGKYYTHDEKGIYKCTVCDSVLFSSADKYDSGSGWPSFSSEFKDGAVQLKADTRFMYPVTEVECAKCGAHLGHIFDDNSQSTGKQYCINSAILDFEKGGEKNG